MLYREKVFQGKESLPEKEETQMVNVILFFFHFILFFSFFCFKSKLLLLYYVIKWTIEIGPELLDRAEQTRYF